MIRQYLGKFIFTALVVGLLGLAWGLKGTQFGQDLAGGAELRYGVTQRVSQQYDRLLRHLSELRDPARKKEKSDRVAAIDELLDLRTTAGDRRVKLENEKANLELQLDESAIRERLNEVDEQRKRVGLGAEIVRDRVDKSGTKDIEVRTVGASRLLIRIPFQKETGETDAEAEKRFRERVAKIERLVSQQGVLGFHLVLDGDAHTSTYTDANERLEDGRPAPKRFTYVLIKPDYDEVVSKLLNKGFIADAREAVEAGYIRHSWKEGEEDPPSRILIRRKADLDGSIIDRAFQRVGERGWEVAMDSKSASSRKVEAFTGDHIEERLAIVLDNVCHSSPTLKAKLSGGGRIEGRFTQAEAENLARVLTAGSLPVEIEFESRSVVGPSLGRDSINRGMMAIIIGTGVVLLFILLYYFAGGVVADVAMAMNLVMLMGALAAFNAKLTLPGIAGVLLTVGMAIDANVLIFERIREEKAKGRTLRLAVQAGYDRAFVTIIDANVTTLLTAIVLYWFGTGPVRGFAITLTLGILASLFTSLYASRAVIEFLVGTEWLSEFTMLRAIGRTKTSFMKVRPAAYTLSVLLVAGGLFVFFSYKDKYGIDFEGGTMLHVRLAEPVSDEEMRAAADAASAKMQETEDEEARNAGRESLDFGKPRVQAFNAEGATVGAGRLSKTYSLILRMDVAQLDEYKELLVAEMAGRLDPENPFPSQESIGQAVSAELGSAAARALVFAVILIFLYIVLRFEFNPSFGVGAVAAVAHDVAITAGAMAAADWAGLVPAKIDLPAVAALLTIVGYSLNDTIVVFDRIRELRLAGKSRPLKEIVDEAVNAVLSRTIITSLTTLMAVVALFVFGGDATKGFAFAMMVGVVVGTYSSVFIAAPLVVQWESVRARPALKKGLAYAGIALAVLAFAGIIARSVWTAREFDRREGSKEKLNIIWNALSSYEARHEGRFPANLTVIGDEPAVAETKALAGPDATDGVAYHYVSGVRRDDPADTVLMFATDDMHAYGGHVRFVDGRLRWMEKRQIQAAVRSSTERLRRADREVKVIEAQPGLRGAEESSAP
jgi:SecD/SecF fusion protein